MAYQKTTWVDSQEPSINAINLNKMEQGIYDAQYPDSGATGQILSKTATGVEWTDAPNSAVWGNITGDIASQTDLQTELSLKISTPIGGSAGQYLQKTATSTAWATIPASATKIEKNVTLLSASWSSGSYTITDSDIGANSTVFLTYPASTSDADYEVLQAACIRATAQASGSITLKATGDVPSSDVTITMIIWG